MIVAAPAPPSPAPKDLVADKLKEFKHTENEIKGFKEIMLKLKDIKPDAQISLDVFKQIRKLEVGKRHECFNFVLNEQIIKDVRHVKHMIENKRAGAKGR